METVIKPSSELVEAYELRGAIMGMHYFQSVLHRLKIIDYHDIDHIDITNIVKNRSQKSTTRMDDEQI